MADFQMNKNSVRSINRYQIFVAFSVLFSLIGFSYNVWRLEITENNSNTRMACFEMLNSLAALEQLVYAAHYDQDAVEGNPRKGWVKIILIEDLSVLTKPSVEESAASLKDVWSQRWEFIANHRPSVDEIILAIDKTRVEIKIVLKSLD